MDLVIQLGESILPYNSLPTYITTHIIPPSSLLRDSLTLWLISTVGGILLYFTISIVAFYMYYDRKLLKHPKFLDGQIKKEIRMAMVQYKSSNSKI